MVIALPPIALPSRLANLSFVSINRNGETISAADGAEFIVPEDAVNNGTSIKLQMTPLENLGASDIARTLPSYLEPRSPLYAVTVQGEQPTQMHVVVPLPFDVESLDTMDLYALWNQRWFKIPFVLNTQDERIESTLNFAPEAVIVVETFPRAPVIAADLSSRNTLPDLADNILVQVNPHGLQLADEGSIAGEPIGSQSTNASSNFAVVPTVTNIDANGVRTDLTGNMMEDPSQREAHINALVDLAVQKVYRGYNVAYMGLGTSDRELYTAFIRELARQLHAKQKTLSLTLPPPTPISEEEFDTGGYDWALLGRYADEVKVPLLDDPRSFEGEPTLQDQYLRWTVGQVDRSKIQLIASTQGRDSTAESFTPIALSEALQVVGTVNIPPDAQPGSDIELELGGLAQAGGIEHHEPSGLFYFNYSDEQGTAHTVWLENADSVSRKVALALKYNLGGIVITDYNTNAGMDERIWVVLENYRSMQPTIVDNQLELVWSVDGQQIGTSSVREPRVIWQAPEDGGQHEVQVALSVDGGVSAGPPASSVVMLALQPTPDPTEPPEPTNEPEPTPRPAARATAAPSGGGNTTQPAAPPPPRPASSNFAGQNMFNYGIQIDWTSKDRDTEMGQVQGMGFRWVKIQVRWCDIESGGKGVADFSGPDDLINRANARGIKVLFSVLCAPHWSRSNHTGEGPPDNPQDAADFFGGLAGKYCNTALGAIEVWNEENLQREWNGAPLSAASYMDMLKRVYPAIKAACPSIVVVSGAPTPTGWNDGVVAIDDHLYLEQLYQNGLKDFSDAIGSHPSGYNVPAMCNITDPACNRPEASFRAPFDNRHPSWSFLSTMAGYRNIMVRHGDGNKQIWPTEFGWPTHTGGSCGGGPCHPAGADNSPEQAAQWYTEAYQWGKQQGWVGVMIAWQLDFDRGELDAFRILGKPAYDALAAMPK
jgi:spore germination protein YaaH